MPSRDGGPRGGVQTSHGLGLAQGGLFHHMLLSKASPDPRRAEQTPPGVGRHDTVTLQRVRLGEGIEAVSRMSQGRKNAGTRLGPSGPRGSLHHHSPRSDLAGRPFLRGGLPAQPTAHPLPSSPGHHCRASQPQEPRRHWHSPARLTHPQHWRSLPLESACCQLRGTQRVPRLSY